MTNAVLATAQEAQGREAVMLWDRLYFALSAREALSVGDKNGPRLNARGERILRYLRNRRRRTKGQPQ